MTVVFDLDGTTIFKGKKMTADIASAILKLSKSRKVVFASARPIRDMLPVLPEDFHEFTLIGGNGAFIKDQGKIATTAFSSKEKDLIFKLIENNNLNYMVDSSWDYSYQGDTNHLLYLGIDPHKQAENKELNALNPVVKAVLFTMDTSIIATLKDENITVHYHGREQLIDLSPADISKWTAFNSLNLKDKLTMFGNDTNDIPMFKQADQSFIIGDILDESITGTRLSQEMVAQTILSLC